MRIGILILLSPLVILTAFAILSINAHSIDDTGDKSADQLIDESNGGPQPVVDTRFATNPHASRAAWGMDSGTSSSIPSSLPGSTISPRDSRAKAEADQNQDEAENTNETVSAQTSSASSATTTSGSWSFELKDSTLKEVVLTLFKSGDAVFGAGSMINGNNTSQVTASGSLDGDQLNLDMMTLGSINLYRFSLTTNGDSASGDYTAFSADGPSWIGSAEGTKSTP